MHIIEANTKDVGPNWLFDTLKFICTVVTIFTIAMNVFLFYNAQNWRDKEFALVVDVDGERKEFRAVECGIYVKYPNRTRFSTQICKENGEVLYETMQPVEQVSYTYKVIGESN